MTVDTFRDDEPAIGDADIGVALSCPRLSAIPAFTDNYIWTLGSSDGARCLVVDPGDAAPVRQWLAQTGCTLTDILVTHHHADHCGGLHELKTAGVTVYGPRRESIAGVDVRVDDGDRIALPALGITLSVLGVSGHTAGHIAFFTDAAPQPEDVCRPILFCGDTLFSAGCGRLFEGSAAQMHASLAKLNALPAETLVCCAHEYTLANLRFAAAVEPENRAINALVAWVRARRELGAPTLPSSLARERRVNPFLRANLASVQEAVLWHGDVCPDETAVFAALRRWKDLFR